MLRVARARLHAAYGVIAYRLGWHGTARRQFEKVLLLRGADFLAYVHLGRIAFDLGDYAGWRREFEHARRTDPQRFARLRHPMELFEPRLAGTSFDAMEREGFEGTDARATWRSLHQGDRSGNDLGLGDATPGESRADRAHADGAARGDLPLAPGFDPLVSGPQLDDARLRESDFDDDPFGEGSFSEPAFGDGAFGDGAFGDGSRLFRPFDEDALPDASLEGDDFSSASERRRFQLRRPIDQREVARCDIDELARRLSS